MLRLSATVQSCVRQDVSICRCALYCALRAWRRGGRRLRARAGGREATPIATPTCDKQCAPERRRRGPKDNRFRTARPSATAGTGLLCGGRQEEQLSCSPTMLLLRWARTTTAGTNSEISGVLWARLTRGVTSCLQAQTRAWHFCCHAGVSSVLFWVCKGPFVYNSVQCCGSEICANCCRTNIPGRAAEAAAKRSKDTQTSTLRCAGLR